MIRVDSGWWQVGGRSAGERTDWGTDPGDYGESTGQLDVRDEPEVRT